MSNNSRGFSSNQAGATYPNQNRQIVDNKSVFFSQTNYGRLLQPLRANFERKLNQPELPERMDKRLQDVLSHYMNEIYEKIGRDITVPQINQEVYRETSLNMEAWLKRQATIPVQKIQSQSQSSQNVLFDSVNSRYEKEQQSRAPIKKQVPANVDFSIAVDDDDDNEDPLEKYERLRKERDIENKATQITSQNAKTIVNNDSLSEPSAPSPATNIPISVQNNQSAPPLLAPRPQEYIIKQEDIVKYKENENNLYIYSADRDWLTNRNENRYNFTISFNPANNSNSSTFSPSIKERFRNIVRIELVKIIISGESLDVSVIVKDGAPNTSRITSILSHPYAMVRISEWTSNGYGTSANIDNTFGIVQYDQAWKSDIFAGNVGYVSMTPRYLKAQRVYQPTPLATLQKLSFQIERPDGQPLTKQLDTLDISNIYIASSTNNSSYSSTPDTESYIFIKTKNYFSRFFVSEGDRIEIRGYDIGTDLNVITAVANDFNSFINNKEGHLVVGTGYSNTGSAPFQIIDGPNSVGYANYIIFRSRFVDPTTGLTDRNYFGGDSVTEGLIKSRLEVNGPTKLSALINLNHQSHFVLRIITREMDSTSNLRPDNS